MGKSSVGLKKIEFADPVAEGLPSVWTTIGDTQIGSASVTETEPTSTDIRIEEKPNSIYRRLTTEGGIEQFAANIYDLSADTILALKGGSVTGDGSSTAKKWSKSQELVTINKAVRITTFDDFVITFPNGLVQATINWPLTVGDLGQIAITVTAQAPLDSDLSDVEITEPLPA